MTIEARQSVTVPFSITVTADATPGDHPAGIVATLSTPAGADGAVNMDRRVGARSHLRVPGEITPMLRVQNLSADFTGQWSLTEGGASTVSMDLVNTGNVRLAGDTTLQISGPLGLWNRSIELGTIPEILPRNQIHVTGTADDVPPLIMLTHEVRLRLATVGDHQVGELPTPEPEYARVSAMPWLWLIILLAVVGRIAYLVQSRSRARRQLAAALARADGGDGDKAGTGPRAGDAELRKDSSGDSPGAEGPDGRCSRAAGRNGRAAGGRGWDGGRRVGRRGAGGAWGQASALTTFRRERSAGRGGCRRCFGGVVRWGDVVSVAGGSSLPGRPCRFGGRIGPADRSC